MYLCKLKYAPAAESLPGLIKEWCYSLDRSGLHNPREDTNRIRTAFNRLIDKCEEWPSIATFYKHLDNRKLQPQLPEYVVGEISDEVAKENLKRIRNIVSTALPKQHKKKSHKERMAELQEQKLQII